MTLVTRDATSLQWTPRSAAEYTSLLSGRGISNPILLWMPGDPASGSVPDLIGTFVGGVNTSAGNYQNAVPGWATKALLLSDASAHKVVNGDAGLPDISTTSALVFAWVGYTVTVAAERSVVTLGPNYGTQTAHDIWASTPNRMALAWAGGSSIGNVVLTTANASGVHPIILQHDRSTGTQRFQTEAETKTHAISIETGKAIALGGDNANWWFAGGVQYILVALWSGAAAELDTAHRAALIDAHVNGPAVTSIAVTPTPVSLASIGNTRQMTATATRADSSTFDCTDGTNVPSTATATWASDNPSVATVSATGLVTAVAAGTANITRSFTSLGAATATSTAVPVTVGGAATLISIAVTPADPSLGVGGTQQMVAIGTYSDASTANVTATATWTTSKPARASVSSTGLVKAIAAGTTAITATVGSVGGSSTVYVSSVRYVGMLTSLLPPGRVWRLIGASILFKLLEAIADELGRVDARAYDLLTEANPSTAIELLPEYEGELDLASTGTNEERQARIVARKIARQRFRPVDFQTAIAPLFSQDAADVVVLERTHAMADSMGDDREIYDFFVYRDPTLPGDYFITSAQQIINDIKPSHTCGFAIESIDFDCDDVHSLCDSDLLGA